jgi:hypothetical protein
MTPGGGGDSVNVTTNANGVATLNQMGGSSVSAYYANGSVPLSAHYAGLSVNFHLTVVAGTGPNYSDIATIVSGNNQTQTLVGNQSFNAVASFNPLSIHVTDLNGNPAPNVKVGYGCGGALCNLPPTEPTTTDSNGNLMVSGMTVMGAPGPLSVQFSGDTLNGVSFSLNAVDSPVTWVPGAQLAIVSGNNQSAARTGTEVAGGIASFAPISVKITAPDGTPVTQGRVTFLCHATGQSACQMSPGGGDYNGVWVMTDGNGVATLNGMGNSSIHYYYGAGAFTVTISYGSIASVTVHLTVTQ